MRLGKKWASISTKMEGRNENAVKNRYTSLVRSLVKSNPELNTNNINDVIYCFKDKNMEFESPTKKRRLNKSKEKTVKISSESSKPLLEKEKESSTKKNLQIPLEIISPTYTEKSCFRRNSGLDTSKKAIKFADENTLELDSASFRDKKADSPKKVLKFVDEINREKSPNCSPIVQDKNASTDFFTGFSPAEKRMKHTPSDLSSSLLKKVLLGESRNNMSIESSNNPKNQGSIEDIPSSIFDKKNLTNLEIKKMIKARKSIDLLGMRRDRSPTNFQRSKDKKTSWFSTQDSPQIRGNKAMLYDVALYCLPNIYSKYSPEEELSKISIEENSYKKEIYRKMIQENVPMELDDLSQRISSMSLSDQLLQEANKILTEISSKFSERGHFVDSIAGSGSSDGLFSEEKKDQLLVSKYLNCNSQDSISQISFDDPFRRQFVRCRTHNEQSLANILPIEETNEENHKLSPNLDTPSRKKKSATLVPQNPVFFPMDNN